MLVASLPDPRFGLAFVAATAALLVLLDALTRGLQRLAARLQAATRRLPLELQLALANLQQPASPLRPALLSLGCGAHAAGGLHAGGRRRCCAR